LRVYFKDQQKNVRCIDGQLGFGIENQTQLQTVIKESTNIKPMLPILKVIENPPE